MLQRTSPTDSFSHRSTPKLIQVTSSPSSGLSSQRCWSQFLGLFQQSPDCLVYLLAPDCLVYSASVYSGPLERLHLWTWGQVQSMHALSPWELIFRDLAPQVDALLYLLDVLTHQWLQRHQECRVRMPSSPSQMMQVPSNNKAAVLLKSNLTSGNCWTERKGTVTNAPCKSHQRHEHLLSHFSTSTSACRASLLGELVGTFSVYYQLEAMLSKLNWKLNIKFAKSSRRS